jgi:hypothetical protein
MGQGTRSRLVRRDVLELQTPQFYFAPGDTNVFTGPTGRLCTRQFTAGFLFEAEHRTPEEARGLAREVPGLAMVAGLKLSQLMGQ